MSGSRYALTRVPGLAELLQHQAGLARRAQLRALGITSNHVAEQVAAGRWRLVAPEVVSSDNGRLDLDQLRWRAVLHAPCSWLGGRSALELRGLSGYPPPTVHVLVPRDRKPQPLAGVTSHVTARLPQDQPESPNDELPAAVASPTARREPLGHLQGSRPPSTSVVRAAVDGAAWDPHPRSAAGLVLAVVQQRLAHPAEVLDELGLAGRIRHRSVVRDALAHAIDGAESLAEVDIVPLLRQAGLGPIRRQVAHRGRRHDIAVDLPDGRLLVIEIDGPTHESPEARWADAERDVDLAVDGVVVLRLTTYEIRHEPARVVRRLRAIHETVRRRAASEREPRDVASRHPRPPRDSTSRAGLPQMWCQEAAERVVTPPLRP